LIVPATTPSSPLISDADAEALWFRDTLLRILVASEHTDGRFAVIETRAPAGSMTPLHSQSQTETFTVLEGVTVHAIDEQVIEAGPGDTILIPEGTTHAFGVREASRTITMLAPGGHEEFFRLAGVPAQERTLPPAPTPLDLPAFKAAARAAGFEILGPPPAALIEAVRGE
jgi:quercetin dioxygenase-like cupin family protein